MSLFGLTTLGPVDPVQDFSAPHQIYPFHEIPEEAYEEAFNKYLLGSNSQIATILEVDGDSSVLRASLGDMLRTLLGGRQPRKHELDAWFTALDFDRSAILGINEYRSCTQNLVEFSGNPKLAKEYTSFVHFNESWRRHNRVEYNLQQTNRAPMTTNQDIGWHSLKPGPTDRIFKGLSQTDVTKQEGRNAADYYGHFICGKFDRYTKK
ncbi:hypothetical protein CEUSTIGMA_g352.t1 [Chlamydomonas eustigma]|uniref:EF-hand domain-containing protein n=1 Tax=Chlamydomonas eustigma TaxID=1157962 RepID=A0A250WPX9_9CHLO|nr:hypothetical protein CEUSTIGMA_g352.t1 [Chlamydomonas eustigma]|eukprot:GAX72897.1 hypothetical protein CEUSTIGMA_g352.t1 [Chlamydomonas eustigma]